ncbi:MAG: TadE family protein [Gemmobacter sp.]|jgi:hypothetical protein
MTLSSSSAENRAKGLGLRRFWHAECGAILVEFALVLPMMLLVFAVIVEGSRMMWSYQAAISGVRDATRYLARILPSDICASGGSAGSYADTITAIVDRSISGGSVVPGGITVQTVTPSFTCHEGSYRGGNVAVAEVSAQVEMTFPMVRILQLFGAGSERFTTTITDRSRVYGA